MRRYLFRVVVTVLVVTCGVVSLRSLDAANSVDDALHRSTLHSSVNARTQSVEFNSLVTRVADEIQTSQSSQPIIPADLLAGKLRKLKKGRGIRDKVAQPPNQKKPKKNKASPSKQKKQKSRKSK